MSLVQHTSLQRVWADKDQLKIHSMIFNRRHLPPVFCVVNIFSCKQKAENDPRQNISAFMVGINSLHIVL